MPLASVRALPERIEVASILPQGELSRANMRVVALCRSAGPADARFDNDRPGILY